LVCSFRVSTRPFSKSCTPCSISSALTVRGGMNRKTSWLLHSKVQYLQNILLFPLSQYPALRRSMPCLRQFLLRALAKPYLTVCLGSWPGKGWALSLSSKNSRPTMQPGPLTSAICGYFSFSFSRSFLSCSPRACGKRERQYLLNSGVETESQMYRRVLDKLLLFNYFLSCYTSCTSYCIAPIGATV